MRNLGKFIVFLSVALLFSQHCNALSIMKTTDKVSAELVTEFENVKPRQNFGVMLKITPKSGWHILASYPGDLGIPTEVKWNLPQGFELKEEIWSKPEIFNDDGIVQYGYSRSAYYQVKITSPEKNLELPLEAKVSWQACKDECIWQEVKFDLLLPEGNELKPNPLWKMIVHEAGNEFAYYDVGYFLFILLMAFLGGVVLNFMPCIFPILALKAISLAQTSNSKKQNRIESLCYSLGVILSFMIIASVLIILRAKGEQIGWGFQLQSPVFVAIMMAVFFIIFLMLLDVIRFHNPFANRLGRISFKQKIAESFVTGFFAVLIASPCTAPFMGIAIGYTLTQPIYLYYPVFLALSIGYALPFALVGLFPKFVHKILPRSGRWMDVLKKIFALPVFLTVLWLGWILSNQVNLQSGENSSWQVYSPSQVSYLVDKKEKVFIDFTAKWCITCLMNKKAVLDKPEFAELAQKHKVHLFRADWTNRDEQITKSLEKYGRNSIPLYVYYDGKSDEYILLPQILTLRSFYKIFR